MKTDCWTAKMKFFQCECHGHAVSTSKYDNSVVELTFWSLGSDSQINIGLREKLRWIWHILKTGKPYSDMIWLRNGEAQRLGVELINLSRKKVEE